MTAFYAVTDLPMTDDYAEELADVSGRAAVAEVLVAVDRNDIVGSVTFIPDGKCPFAEDIRDGECGVRMMAVAPSAQGRGVGQLLLEAALARGRELGREAVFLHSTPQMTAAHRLYQRNGFVRTPERDWFPVPELSLLAFRLELDGRDPAHPA
ncbi:MAG: GNAT family N-acetyltransferase [Acidimicrobiales bacterium]